MATSNAHLRLGRDLALTRYTGTSGMAPLDSADSWGTLDLKVTPAVRSGVVRRVRGVPDAPPAMDIAVVSGRENLGQALVLRLLTPKGALAPLGHPDYGSRLPSLIGELNTETTRNLARLYTIEAIGQERRVRTLEELAVGTVADQPDTIRIALSVLPIDDDEPLALTLEVTL
jgi:phage baseplate assembly protein W